jgi:hypothetical protein
MSVVALGAWCDLVPEAEYGGSPGGLSFSVSEFAVMDDGRRLMLHAERGWTQWVRTAGPPGQPPTEQPLDPWSMMTRDSVVQDALNVVLPDDDDDPEDHPYEWLAELLAAQGVTASADQLRDLPYTVELTPRLESRLAAVAADPG